MLQLHYSNFGAVPGSAGPAIQPSARDIRAWTGVLDGLILTLKGVPAEAQQLPISWDDWDAEWYPEASARIEAEGVPFVVASDAVVLDAVNLRDAIDQYEYSWKKAASAYSRSWAGKSVASAISMLERTRGQLIALTPKPPKKKSWAGAFAFTSLLVIGGVIAMGAAYKE